MEAECVLLYVRCDARRTMMERKKSIEKQWVKCNAIFIAYSIRFRRAFLLELNCFCVIYVLACDRYFQMNKRNRFFVDPFYLIDNLCSQMKRTEKNDFLHRYFLWSFRNQWLPIKDDEKSQLII